MAIRAVVFDIGGVLEITPDLGITRQWEIRLGLVAGELHERMFVDDSEACVAGARESGLHAVRYQDNAQAINEIEALLSPGGTVDPELSHDRTQAT
jgi:FMN phosphatase YigB (HAD superfamily)